MPKVALERHIEQIADGTAYKGHIKFADTALDYELNFGIPIPKISKVVLPEDQAEIRRIFTILVKKGGSVVQLDDSEWGFFFKALVVFAAQFYESAQTRDSNKGAMGHLVRGTHPHNVMGMSVSIAMTSQGKIDLSPETCAMLNAPKFDCKIAA